MNQRLSGPVVLAAVAVLLLLLVFMYRRSTMSPASQVRVSPGFQQLSPEEQRKALEGAAKARLRRGAPPQPQPPPR